MAVFQLGPIIKNRRIELGLSQEDLADGICSVPTLSRIENGERMPTKNHFEMLMQRLGYSAMSLDFFTDKHDFKIHELKFQIRQAYVTKDFQLAERLLNEYKGLINNDSNIDQQFFLLYDTLLNIKQYSAGEELALFESALRLTCPSYNKARIPHVLSYEEIILLNNIAICYGKSEKHYESISILRTLKTYYDTNIVNSEEALRTQQLVLYNLSKALGLVGYYDECLEICDESIHLAKRTARCTYLGQVLYNRAWVLVKRNQEGDRTNALIFAKQSCNFFQIMGDAESVKFVQAFIEKNNLDGK
jgi:transcriptional regulator with XRE-family HTH domain